jgi:hypothetical protein
MGKMTGRAAGFCAGSGMPGAVNFGSGRGAGMGFGRGRQGRGFGGNGHGRRNMFRATGLPGWMRFGGGDPVAELTPEAEKDFLKAQSEALESQLDEVRKRLAEIETDGSKK